MARPARLVNCSLVFLLVIRCIRAPGQRPTRLRAQRASERGQAHMAPLCSRDNYHIGIGRHMFLTRDDLPATCIALHRAGCTSRRSRYVCVRALARGTCFYERSVVRTSRGTTERSARMFSRNTQLGNARVVELHHHLPACSVT